MEAHKIADGLLILDDQDTLGAADRGSFRHGISWPTLHCGCSNARVL
jgi:hypothetical protein